MAQITYPLGLLFDDAGAILTAPVVAISSVVTKAGVAVASHGATVNGSGTATPISVDYDAATKGEAWITLAVSQSGRTVTGPNATLCVYCALLTLTESDRIAAKILANPGFPLLTFDGGSIQMGEVLGDAMLTPLQYAMADLGYTAGRAEKIEETQIYANELLGKIGNFGTGKDSLRGLLEFLFTSAEQAGGFPAINGIFYEDYTGLGLPAIATVVSNTLSTAQEASDNASDVLNALPPNFSTLTIGTGANAGKVVTSNPATGGSGGGATAAEIRTELTTELTRITTALPNAGPAATGGLLTRGTGAGQLNASGAGKIPVTLAAADFSGTIAASLADKTGFSLTSGERTAIANEVEAQIIDDTDSERVLQAITDKIAAVNPSLGSLTLAAIASAVKTSVEAAGGSLAAVKAKTDNLPADPASNTQVATRLAASAYTAPTTPPTAVQNAAAVWGAATRGVTALPNPAPAGYGGSGSGGGSGGGTIIYPIYCGDDYPRERPRFTAGDTNQLFYYNLRGADGQAVPLASNAVIVMRLLRRGETATTYTATVIDASEGKVAVTFATVPEAGDYLMTWTMNGQTFPIGGGPIPVRIYEAL